MELLLGVVLLFSTPPKSSESLNPEDPKLISYLIIHGKDGCSGKDGQNGENGHNGGNGGNGENSDWGRGGNGGNGGDSD